MVESGALIGWGLIILGSAVLLLVITMVVYLYRRWKSRSVLVNIIHQDGVITRRRIGKIGKRFKVQNRSYVYDQDCELKDRWHKQIYYWWNNPNPIKFDRPSQELKLTSTNLTNVVEDNFITKLFSPSGFTTENLLILFALGGIAALLYFTLFDPPAATLVGSEENMNVIKDACLAAFRGG